MSSPLKISGLHAVIESRLNGPSILLVTGAMPSDDTATVSQRITDLFRSSGSSVALVRLLESGMEAYSDRRRAEIQVPAHTSSRSEIESMVATWRNTYDLVVVDASPLIDSPLAPRMATIADGTVLVVAQGRRITAADSTTSHFLGSLNAKLLGVVMAPRLRSSGLFSRLVARFTTSKKRRKTSDAAPLFLRS